jgi:hypothetical protein
MNNNSLENSNAFVTFYYCNSVIQHYKDFSMWNYLGFYSVCGHMEGHQKCEKIFLSNFDEQNKFYTMYDSAIKKHNTTNKEKNDKFSWKHTLKFTLMKDTKYSDRYKVVDCSVHCGRFCAAK